jgi:hypothetical protein
MLRLIGLSGAILSLFTGRLIGLIKINGTLLLGAILAITSILMMLFLEQQVIYMTTILFISSISLLIPTIVTKIGQLSGSYRVKTLSLYSFILLVGASFAPPLVIHLSLKQTLVVILGYYLLNLYLIITKGD